ncbi:MAG: hypothetical protein OEX75_09460, partial [Gammaproteobacteria bacterium]|nr:hypothetical protein [Gammaproteobacteria bacterium]
MKFGSAKSGKKTQEAVADAGSTGKPVSLARFRTQLLVSSVAILGLLGWFIFQYMGNYIGRVIEQETTVTTGQIAARVSATVEFYGDTAARLAKDPDIAYLLARGDGTALRAREESLRYAIPDAINVQLLPPGLDRVDENRSPPLSYAALAQLRAAEASVQPPMAEVHLFNTPQQHVNIVRRVEDPAGSGVVGHVMVSLSNKVLQSALGGLHGTSGYLELQQAGEKGPVVIATHGDGQYKGRDADRVALVTGTRWQVAYWPEISRFVYLGKISLWVLVAIAVAVLSLVSLILLQFRGIMQGVRQNEISMVSLMKDFKQDQVKREYAGGLKEMDETLATMVRVARGRQKPEPLNFAPAPRERDRDYLSGSPAPVQGGEMAAGTPANFDS